MAEGEPDSSHNQNRFNGVHSNGELPGGKKGWQLRRLQRAYGIQPEIPPEIPGEKPKKVRKRKKERLELKPIGDGVWKLEKR